MADDTKQARIVHWEPRHGIDPGAVNDGWVACESHWGYWGSPPGKVLELRLRPGETAGEALERLRRVVAGTDHHVPFTDTGAAWLSMMFAKDGG